MGTPNRPGKFDCRPDADEPYFTLLGRDPLAADLVQMWADRRHKAIKQGLAPISDVEKVFEAYRCATDMRTYYILSEMIELGDKP